ncbi:MAG TPA: TadE family protein [Acidimicrobiales bacterium]|nr:TadE family protein [Acidimicrobiales bacterium]
MTGRWSVHSGSGAEEGSAALEVALVTPLLLVALLFVIGLGRLASARGQIEQAARDAARAASIARTPGTAQADAEQAAAADLAGDHLTCGQLNVAVDAASFRPGGTVAVDLGCTVSLADVVAAGFPGTHRLTATAVAPVDRYRGSGPSA